MKRQPGRNERLGVAGAIRAIELLKDGGFLAIAVSANELQGQSERLSY